MDPLSNFASTAGLISIADLIAGKGWNFIKEIKGAAEEVKSPLEETTNLFGILNKLELIIERYNDEEFDFTMEAQSGETQGNLQLYLAPDEDTRRRHSGSRKDSVDVWQSLLYLLDGALVRQFALQEEPCLEKTRGNLQAFSSRFERRITAIIGNIIGNDPSGSCASLLQDMSTRFENARVTVNALDAYEMGLYQLLEKLSGRDQIPIALVKSKDLWR
ncbi:hypothetical protein B7494_g3578 [Chlorociboria aeruginascens]|nr:hypothetical protein B7494_g3578 [Chlorociboria aeruginascens]